MEMTVTAEGLRIELMESEAGTFFESGNPVPTPNGREFLIALAQQLGQLPNKISIEGHTDTKPFASGRNYGNWELSADRANAARRLMQHNGVNANQVLQIRGYADQRLRKPDSPGDPSNRRKSVIVQYLVEDVESKGVEESKTAEASGKNEHADAPAKTEHYDFTTCRLLVTPKTPDTPFARMPAVFLSASLSTTPSRVTLPPLTMMRIGCCTPSAYLCKLGKP
jgi:OmpA family